MKRNHYFSVFNEATNGSFVTTSSDNYDLYVPCMNSYKGMFLLFIFIFVRMCVCIRILFFCYYFES